MELKAGSHIYFMGICGTAMSSLACLFKKQGYFVNGSDQNVYPPISDHLTNSGIPYFTKFSKDNLKKKPDLIIVGNVISSHFEEVKEMERLAIPHLSLSEALSKFFIEGKKSVMPCGTHGKTTSCSILISILDSLEKDFGFLLGGIDKNKKASCQLPNEKAEFFVIEGDEYDTAFFDKRPKFVHYKPHHVILTSIEFDHADIYKDLNDVKKSFSLLFENIHPEGHLVYNAEDENIQDLLKLSKSSHLISYGQNKGDYRLKNLNFENDKFVFDIFYKEKFITKVNSNLFGLYNALNMLGCFALFHSLGFDLKKIVSGLEKCQGVKRRQEFLGEFNGVKIIEDFAHHPTSVRLTLDSFRKKYPDQRLFCVFEPRSATSRRKVFQKDYVNSFDKKADYSLIFKAFFQDKIDEEERFSSQDLVDDLNKKGNKSLFFDETKPLIDFLMEKTQKGDVVLLMSNGGFHNLYEDLLSRFKNKKD